MTRLKLAVIGAGHLGRIHARLLAGQPDVELIGVADPSAEARHQAETECGVPAHADYRCLLDQIDAAVVATPTRLHHAVALEALSRGIHVLVEKPLAATLAEADDLVTAARRRGRILQVGHIERFNPALAAAIPHVERPKYIEAARYGGYTFRSTDIGVVLDLMIHDLDLTLSLARSRVVAVEALGLAVLGGQEDVAQARLTFENGCVANLSASRVSYRPLRQMQIWSECGYVNIDFATRAAAWIKPSAAIVEREFDGDDLPAEEKNRLREHLFEDLLPITRVEAAAENALLLEQQDFVESIRQGREPRVTGEQGRAALAVAERILERIATHSWDGAAGRLVGPLATPGPEILRGPHWPRPLANPPAERKEAG